MFKISKNKLIAIVLLGIGVGFSDVIHALPTTSSIEILVDDFEPQPLQVDTVYYFNRLDGDRGGINTNLLEFSKGQVKLTIPSGNSWGGMWTSLNHPIRENLSVNFSGVLPPEILPDYQSQITNVTVHIKEGTAGKIFRVELKDTDNVRQWYQEIVLNGGSQFFDFPLSTLGNISQLVWVLDNAAGGDSVVIDRITLTATRPTSDPAIAAFIWSYGMLLNNWNSDTGLIRDKAKDASGEFDAIQATGSLAAATAVAYQLGIISHDSAVRIVQKITDTLLTKIPTLHGLLPHWVKGATTGQISNVGEWSSVDTVIALIGLLDAQNGMKLDTSGTINKFRSIVWSNLIVTPGCISHGYNENGDLIPYCWDTFGGESWLVELAYTSVMGQVTPLPYPNPPTANGSGFIDELAWLFILPPSRKEDVWGNDWRAYRSEAVDKQISYYPINYPGGCFDQFHLFGLSAAEVPDPSRVSKTDIYQAFGIGNDGSKLLGAPVVVPHYSGMVASLRPQEAIAVWDWLIGEGYFTPLNNVESFMFPSITLCNSVTWNQLKGSWNLALQTIGLGTYLAKLQKQTPILWKATRQNAFLRSGYKLLVP